MALQNVPQANQDLLQTQNPILTNFATIDSAFSQNHLAYGTGIGVQGKHTFLQMPQQAAAPTTLVGEGGLSVLAGASSGNPELNWTQQNNGPTYAFTEGCNGNPGWCRLPSGILMLWGFIPMNNSIGAQTIAYNGFICAPVFPGFATAVYSVQLTPMTYPAANVDSDNFVLLGSFGNRLSFTIDSIRRTAIQTGRPNQCTMLAIGI